MKIYISASYANKQKAADLAHSIAALGENVYEVISSWHWDKPNDDDGIRDGLSFEDQKKFATIDLDEVDRCDLLIALTERAGSPYTRGGRHVEFGYAMALGKDTIAIGPTENIFHALADRRFPAFGDPCNYDAGVTECLADLWERRRPVKPFRFGTWFENYKPTEKGYRFTKCARRGEQAATVHIEVSKKKIEDLAEVTISIVVEVDGKQKTARFSCQSRRHWLNAYHNVRKDARVWFGKNGIVLADEVPA